jgi:biopolymer transport protein TolR
MAVSSNGGGTNGKRRGARFRPMSEINVTPLVDVMLVLLVIFMITAPLLTVGVPVNLPQEKSHPLTGDEEPLTVTIDQEGKIFLQETPVEMEELVPRLTAIAANGYEQRVYVRGDKNVNYGTVMAAMSRMSEAGFTRLALVAEQPAQEEAKKKKSRG